MDKKAMLDAIISHYSNGNKSRFAQKLGITPQAISTWEKRNTFDIALIYANCEGISSHWLLTGEGDMLLSSKSVPQANNIANGSHNQQTVVTATDDSFWKDLVTSLRRDLDYWKERCTNAEEQVHRLEDLNNDNKQL